MRLELTSERGCVDLEVGDVDRLAEDVARHATVEAAVLSVHPGDGVAVQLRSDNAANWLNNSTTVLYMCKMYICSVQLNWHLMRIV